MTKPTLKRGGSITWDIWMGAQDDPTVDTSWTQFYVKLLNADGAIVHNNITGIPSEIIDSSDAHYGWRPLTWDGSAAHMKLTYDIVNDSSTFKKYLTGIVLA